MCKDLITNARVFTYCCLDFLLNDYSLGYGMLLMPCGEGLYPSCYRLPVSYCLAAATLFTLNRPLTSALSLPFELRPPFRLCDFPNLALSPSSSTVASSARFLGTWQLYLIPCGAQSLPLFFFLHTRQCRQGRFPSTSSLTVGVRARGQHLYNFWNRLIGLVPFFSLPSGRRWYAALSACYSIFCSPFGVVRPALHYCRLVHHSFSPDTNLALSWRWGLSPPSRGNQQVHLLLSASSGRFDLVCSCTVDPSILRPSLDSCRLLT